MGSSFTPTRKEGKMETVKNFVKEHKKELSMAAAAIIIYRMGFNRGFNTAKSAITHVFDEAARTLPIARF